MPDEVLMLLVPPPSPMSFDDAFIPVDGFAAPTLTLGPADLAIDGLAELERTGFAALETTGLVVVPRLGLARSATACDMLEKARSALTTDVSTNVFFKMISPCSKRQLGAINLVEQFPHVGDGRRWLRQNPLPTNERRGAQIWSM